MLHKKDRRLNEAAARILSHIGASARSEISEAGSTVEEAKEKLLHLCEHGTPKAAKAAVRSAPILSYQSQCLQDFLSFLIKLARQSSVQHDGATIPASPCRTG